MMHENSWISIFLEIVKLCCMKKNGEQGFHFDLFCEKKFDSIETALDS